MSRPLRIEYPGAFYHITSRGNERRNIFRDDKEREQFLSYFGTATDRYKAVIHVYCLMSNHYHLLLETPLGNLSQIMHHINGAYTTYFNKRHKRSGHLFQGRYKAIVVDKDEYAAELSRYIHLNPVRAGIVKNPDEYPWSSYRYYSGKRKRPEWLVPDFILSYFGKDTSEARKGYRKFVNEVIGKDYESPLKETVASLILGGEDFIHKITERYIKGRKVDRNVPSLRKLSGGPLIEDITKESETVFEGDTVIARKAILYLCHKYSRMTLKEIGAHFGIGESAVSQNSRRFTELLNKDGKLRRKVEIIKKNLNLSNV